MTDRELSYEYEAVNDYYVIEAWRGQPDRPPAYTPQMVERHTRAALARPCVHPVAGAEADGLLGWTPGWQANPAFPNDPVIPPQPIFAYRIGDGDPEAARFKMVFTSGNHANEFTGNWMLEGLVDFLVSNDPRAVRMRRDACFFIYPDVNPEGRYQGIHRLAFEAAPDPNVGANLRDRGNPHLYATGEADNNRVWTSEGRFAHIDILKQAMRRNANGPVDIHWDFHGPQEPGNWRSAQGHEAWETPYGRALVKREPDVVIAGLPGGFKAGLSFDAGKLSVWSATAEGLNARHSYVYEPGGWAEPRLKEAGINLVLALDDAISR